MKGDRSARFHRRTWLAPQVPLNIRLYCTFGRPVIGGLRAGDVAFAVSRVQPQQSPRRAHPTSKPPSTHTALDPHVHTAARTCRPCVIKHQRSAPGHDPTTEFYLFSLSRQLNMTVMTEPRRTTMLAPLSCLHRILWPTVPTGLARDQSKDTSASQVLV